MLEKIIHILATCLLVLAHTNLGVQAAKCLVETWGGHLDDTHYQASINNEATDGETYQVNQFYNGIGQISGVSSARINGNRCVVTFKDAHGSTRCTLPSGDYPYKEFMRNGCENDVVTQYTVSISKATTVLHTTPTPTTPTTEPPSTPTQGATHSTTQGTYLPGVQSPTNPVTNQANTCTDTVAWSDGWGGTCEYYRNSGACKNGQLLDGLIIENSDMFNSPFENCCVCGKPWYARDNNLYAFEICGVTCDYLAGECGLGNLGRCPIDIEKHCPVTCRNKICHNIDNGVTDTIGEGCELYDKNPSRCGYYDDQDFVSRTMCCACGGGGQDACVCNTIVDKDGHGNCQKEYKGQIGCYVQEPSGCGDTIMGVDNRLYSLSKACKLKVFQDCKTKGGDQVNQACVFPFRYNGIEYNRCAKVTHTEPWCSTEVDSQGSYISGKWGTCGSGCPIGGPNYKLLNVNMECQSSEQKLTSRKNDENACAKACKLQNGCQYFIVTGRGDCYWEKTADGTCPEGWFFAFGSNFYETINE